MRERIREIVTKEFRQALREPRLRAMLFVPPLLQLIIFGYAVNLDVENSLIGWMDQDHTQQSRELRDAFLGSHRFTVVATPQTENDVQSLLDRGDVYGVVRVLPGFGRDIERGRATSVQVLVDGSNSNTASIVSNYASQVIARYSSQVFSAQQRDKLVGRTLVAGGPITAHVPTLVSRTRVWFNPDLRSRNYFVPGVVVNIIMLVTLSLTAMAIVREKEIGTMEQLMVTPIRPIELIIGKTLPFALVGLLDSVLIVSVALLVFHVPFRGSFVVLTVSATLFLMTTLGSGLFMSTVSRTQQQAMMSTFLFFLPAFLLSGFAFPIRNMPPMVQYITYVNPVRYFMEIVRGVFLKGTGVDVLWPQMLALAIIGITILLLSVSRFRKTLD